MGKKSRRNRVTIGDKPSKASGKGSDYAAIQKEMDNLLKMADSPKPLDARHLRSGMPKITEALMAETVHPHTLRDAFWVVFRANLIKAGMSKSHQPGEEYKSRDLAGTLFGLKVPHFNQSTIMESHAIMIAYFRVRGIFIPVDGTLPAGGVGNLRYFSEMLLDPDCQEWTNKLDDQLFKSERGAFLTHCLANSKSTEEVKAIFAELTAKFGVAFCDMVKRVDRVQIRTVMAAFGVIEWTDQYKKVCWECELPCEAQDVHTCTGCKMAVYCGETCQKKAWFDGHNKACKSLPGNSEAFYESMDAIEAAHKCEPVQGLRLREWSDTRTVGCAFMQVNAWKVQFAGDEEFAKLKGPSTKYFYDNLKKIQTNGWWFLDDIQPAQRRYVHAVLLARRNGTGEQSFSMAAGLTNFLATVLCYDIMDIFSSIGRDGKDYVDHPRLGVFVSFVYLNCIVPPIDQDEPVTCAQLLDWYHGYLDDLSFNDEDLMLQKRQQKKERTAQFRRAYHK